MSAARRQSHISERICQFLLVLAMLVSLSAAHADEPAVDLADQGTDVLQGSTADADSRSSETSAAAGNLIQLQAVREYVGPLANAVTDADGRAKVRPAYSGRIIGMARNQVVMPGFAAFHIGIQTDEIKVVEEEAEVAEKKQPAVVTLTVCPSKLRSL